MSEITKVIDIMPEAAKAWAQKLHQKKDDIPLVRKFFTVDKVDVSETEADTIVARVSTPDRDRDGEIVEPKGINLTNFQKNPCLLWAHRYDQPAIGKALWSKADENGLICKFQFAPTQFASEIAALYKGGYQRAFSIGFIPVDFDSQTKTFKKVELLEVSAVPVPAHQDALVMEAYAKGIVTSEPLKHDLGLDAPAPVEEKAAIEAGLAEIDTEAATITHLLAEPESPIIDKAPDIPTPEFSIDEAVAGILDLNAKLTAIEGKLAAMTEILLEQKAAPVSANTTVINAEGIKAASDNLTRTVTAPVHIIEITEPTPEEKASREAVKVLKDYISSGALKGMIQQTIAEQLTLAIDKARGKVY